MYWINIVIKTVEKSIENEFQDSKRWEQYVLKVMLFMGCGVKWKFEIVNYSNGTSQMNGLFIVCIWSYHVSKHWKRANQYVMSQACVCKQRSWVNYRENNPFFWTQQIKIAHNYVNDLVIVTGKCATQFCIRST